MLAGRVGLEPTYNALTGRPPTNGAPANIKLVQRNGFEPLPPWASTRRSTLGAIAAIYFSIWWSKEGVEPHALGEPVYSRVVDRPRLVTCSVKIFGAESRTCTHNLLLTRQLLCYIELFRHWLSRQDSNLYLALIGRLPKV